MRRHLVLILLSLSLLLDISPIAHAGSYTFVPIDVPGSLHTLAQGINKQGQIVGTYIDASGKGHGFLLGADVFTPIDVPNSEHTNAFGINKHGEIVGRYVASSPCCGDASFVLSKDSFTTVAFPSTGGNNSATGINDQGDLVGIYQEAGSGHTFVFVLSKGQFSLFTVPPGAANSSVGNVLGLNDRRQVVGVYSDTNYHNGRSRGFLLTDGILTPIDMPDSIGTGAFGINRQGQIVGFYIDVSTHQNRGFVLMKGTFTPIDSPDGFDTIPFGINDLGQIVGISVGADGKQHGFLAIPTEK